MNKAYTARITAMILAGNLFSIVYLVDKANDSWQIVESLNK
jgi:hypothetical protein